MEERHLYLVLVLSIVFLVLGGCGSENGGGPNPVTGVDIEAVVPDIEIGHSTEITAQVTGGESKALTWSVNGVENGNEIYGTITQDSPATYNAPDSLPASATIVIGAVSVETETMMDTCHIHLTFTKMFVDSATGNDATANGCINLPFRTITKALADVQAGMTILVGPGTYSDAAGETFTMYVPAGVSLVGLDWEDCIIRKETPAFDGYNGVQLSGDDSAVRKFTFIDKADPGYSRWSSTVYTEQANSLIDSLRFFQRALMSCIRLDTSTDAVVQNCVFDVELDPPGAGMDRAFEIVFDDVGSIIRNCRVSGFNTALFFNLSSDALVEGCVLENNSWGAYLCCPLSVDSNPNPDFGGGARLGTGGNIFRNNSACGISNTGTSTIYAMYNIWDNDPPVEGVDYCNSGTGSIVVEELPDVPVASDPTSEGGFRE